MGPQRGENLLSPPGVQPRTVKPVASGSTDFAIPARRRHENDHEYEVVKDFNGHVRGINERKLQ
jgi:hypothetical protein